MRNRGVSQTMPFLVIPRSLLRGGFISHSSGLDRRPFVENLPLSRARKRRRLALDSMRQARNDTFSERGRKSPLESRVSGEKAA